MTLILNKISENFLLSDENEDDELLGSFVKLYYLDENDSASWYFVF